MTAGTVEVRDAPTPGSGPVGKPPRRDEFRYDIQGLRGFAVLLVVAEHYLGRPKGAFVGLEFFFVISGFLITGLLLREAGRTETVSILEFYRRRVRRIFPTALVTLALVVIASRVLLSTGRYDGIKTDAWWTFAFLSNWNFGSTGIDYFHQNNLVSPLRHYWSLSVEEQFYVVWPLLVLAIAWWTQRSTRRRAAQTQGVAGRRLRREPSVSFRVGMLALVGGLASFVYALYLTRVDPSAAYYSTFVRIWEILIGALLAAMAGWLVKAPTWLRNVVGGAGLIGIVVSTLTIRSDVGFPAPYGAVPVISAALVIASGVGRRNVASTWVFTLGPFQYFGLISYSLYLAHWPVLVLMQAVHPEMDAFYYVSALSTTIVLTMLLHHLVEMPVLRSRFLLPWKKKGSQTLTRRRQVLHRHNQLVLVGALTVLIALVGVGRVGTEGDEAPAAFPVVARATQTVAQPNGLAILQRNLRRALKKPGYPALAPRLGDAAAGEVSLLLPEAQCINADNLLKADQCNFGSPSAPKLAVVIGDSISTSYLPGIVPALINSGYRVHGMALAGCPVADVEMRLAYDPAAEQRCNDAHRQEYANIQRLGPDLVIMADSASGIMRLKSGNRGAPAVEEWAAGMKRALAAMSFPGRRMVVISPNPTGPDPSECVTRGSAPARCETLVQSWYHWKRMAETAATNRYNADYVDASKWYCWHERCPVYAMGLSMRWDGSHITWAYAKMLTPLLRDAVLGTDDSAGATQRSLLDGVDTTGVSNASLGSSGSAASIKQIKAIKLIKEQKAALAGTG